MKKFLTVLLALSVVFTYSFSAVGSAFAATASQNDWDLLVEDAAGQAKTMANAAYNEAVKVLPDADPGFSTSKTVDADFWKANASVYGNKLDKLIAEKTKEIKALYGTNEDDVKDMTLAEVVEFFAISKGTEYVSGATASADAVPAIADAAVTAIQTDAEVKVAVAKAYGEDVAANAIIALKGINTNIYSDTVNKNTNMSSKEMAVALVNEKVADIEKVDFNVDTVAAVEAALDEVGTFGTATYSAIKDEIEIATETAGGGLLTGFVEAKDPTYNITKYAIKTDTMYNGESLVTKKSEEDDAEDLASLKASYLAQVAAVYSEYITANKGADFKAEAEAYKAGVSEIINAAETLDDLKDIFNGTADITAAKPNANLTLSYYTENKGAIDDLVVLANKYIAEGFDAEEINKIVAGAKVAAFKTNAAWDGKWNGTDDAEDAIETAVAKQFDTKIIDEEVAGLELALKNLVKEDATTGYYAPEAAQVKALYETIINEVKACISQKALNKVNSKYGISGGYNNPIGLSKIDKKTAVQTAIKKTTADWDDNKAKIKAYADSLNAGTKPEEKRDFVGAGIFSDPDTLDEEWLADFYAEKGARTTAEAMNLISAAKAELDAVMTAAQLDAAEAAVEAQIAALPDATKITAGDAAAVEAAWEANQKLIKEAGGKISATAQKTLDNAVKAAGNATKLALLKEIGAYDAAKVTAADKADLEALLAKVKEFNEKVAAGKVYDPTETSISTIALTDVQSCLAKIRTDAKNAVEKAIKALPITVTKENIGLVDTAEKLYNEYVETYTDFYNSITDIYGARTGFNQNAAQDITTVKADLDKAVKAADKIRAEIAAEEKAAQIKAVESFKIKTTTKRYDGKKMVVNWTVTAGDESAIDGYRIYFSTKKTNSGYKYLAKTSKKYINHTSIKKNVKKGTRVYYRVRAYVEIDGQRYFSDYSTVGNRIWK